MEENEEVKRPSAMATRLHVWHFLMRPYYVIPTEHHLNLVCLKGCSMKNLATYISRGNILSDSAILTLVNSGNPELVDIFLKNYKKHKLNSELADKICKTVGVNCFLEHGFQLGPKQTENLVSKGAFELLTAHLRQLYITPQIEASLLSMGNHSFAKQYLAVRRLYKGNENLILLYDDAEFYRLFCKWAFFTDDLAGKILKSKDKSVVKVLLESNYIFSYENFVLLVNKNDSELLKLYFGKGDLSDEFSTYIVSNCDCETIDFLLFDDNSPTRYDFDEETEKALFKRFLPNDEYGLLKKYIEIFRLYDDVEILLFESGNTELRDLYLSDENNELSPKSLAWIMENKLMHLLPNKDIVKVASKGYLSETTIFKLGNREDIKAYIKHNKLTSFGEAMFVKYADADLIADYIKDDYVLDIYAFRALVLRHDAKLMELWYKDNSGYDDEMLLFFLEHAETDLILAFLKQLPNASGLHVDDPDDCCFGEAIFKRNDDELSKFFAKNFKLTYDDLVAMFRYASDDVILLYCENKLLEEDCEDVLVRYRDATLIKSYLNLINQNLSPLAEKELLLKLDEDLVQFYENKFGFKDDGVVGAIEA